MWTIKDETLVLSLNDSTTVGFRLKEEDKSLIEIMESNYFLKSAVINNLKEAIDAFRSGKADYVNAAEKVEQLHLEFAKVSDSLCQLGIVNLIPLLIDSKQESLVLGWTQLQVKQILIDMVYEFFTIWNKQWVRKSST